MRGGTYFRLTQEICPCVHFLFSTAFALLRWNLCLETSERIASGISLEVKSWNKLAYLLMSSPAT